MLNNYGWGLENCLFSNLFHILRLDGAKLFLFLFMLLLFFMISLWETLKILFPVFSVVYGVTTGFGKFARVVIPVDKLK